VPARNSTLNAHDDPPVQVVCGASNWLSRTLAWVHHTALAPVGHSIKNADARQRAGHRKSRTMMFVSAPG
jgi:hypothetical protein